MTWQNLLKWAKSDYSKLVPILGLAFYIAFIAHQNYPYLVHLDEWIHLSCSNEIIKEAAAFGLTDPFRGGPPISNQLFEVGFHVYWAGFHLVSGIDWPNTFKYFPSILFILTVLSVYILTKRLGFGWEAALLTCMIPTTVGILGPGFLVPVAMGLPFIAISLFIAFYLRSWTSYGILFVLILFLFSLHSATAIGLILILIPYILLNLKDNFKHSIGIVLALALPSLIAVLVVPGIKDMLVVPTLRSLFVTHSIPEYITIPNIITTYGYIPIALVLIGSFLLSKKRGRIPHGILFGCLILLLMLAIYYTLGYGVGMMYYRGIQYVMLMMGIIAGAGLMGIRKIRLPLWLSSRIKSPLVVNNLANILCVIVVAVMLYMVIPTRLQTMYYRMIDDKDYQAFIWIRDNVSNYYEKAILDPWKGTAFTAVTGKNIYTWIGEKPGKDDIEANNFLEEGCKDTAFLKENDISIVYTRLDCENPDLIEVEENIYLLKQELIP